MTFQKSDALVCECVGDINLFELARVYSERWLNEKLLERDAEVKISCVYCITSADEHTSDASLGSASVGSLSPVTCAKGVENGKTTPHFKKKFKKFNIIKLLTQPFSKKGKLSTENNYEPRMSPTTVTECTSVNKGSAATEPLVPHIATEDELFSTTMQGRSALFICSTCAICCCLRHTERHARDSHCRCPSGNIAEKVGTLGQEDQICRPFSSHCIFIAIPQHTSTHPNSHLMSDVVPDPLNIFPTVLIQDFESGGANPAASYKFYTDAESQLDKAFFSKELSKELPEPHNSVFSSDVKDGTFSVETMHVEKGSFHSTLLPVNTIFKDGNNKGEGTSSTCLELPLPKFYYNSANQWSLQALCWRCTNTPYCLSDRVYNDKNYRHRTMRRLCQMMPLLDYLRRLRVRLVFLHSTTQHMQVAPLHSRSVVFTSAEKRPSTSLLEMQQVRKSTEMLDYSIDFYDHTSESKSRETGSLYTTHNPLLSTRANEAVLVRAKISGFANPGYFCYINAVLQCVLRCVFLTRPLLRMQTFQSPGNLTTAMHNLLRHLNMQTESDVRSGRVSHFVKRVHMEICKVSCLFRQDEQQDAQEFLLCLLNGIADEFDKDRNAEEKKKSNRISFEGTTRIEVMCSSCHHKVPREEMFMLLSIPAKKSIEDGVKMAFAPAHLKEKNLYACENCFRLMSLEEQEAHNKLAREQKKHPDPSKLQTPKMSENCVYQEAEMCTHITRLGGTLAVHLLRFHYNAMAQDFIKINTPVKISMTLDLHPYVTNEVVELYRNKKKLERLQLPFSAFDGTAPRPASRQNGSIHPHNKAPRLDSGPTEAGIPSKNGTARLPLPHPAATTASAAASAASGDENGDLAGVVSVFPEQSDEVLRVTSEQFDAFGEHARRVPSLVRHLVGIVTHHGSLHGGHFIAYVRSLSVPNVWFCCDDDVVEVVNEAVIHSCSSEVYMAFYE